MSAASWEDEHARLLGRAGSSRDPDEKVRVLEAAVRLADHHGDVGRGYDARRRLVTEATLGGQAEKALVAFAWCRAQTRKEPERFKEAELLWSHKWVVNDLPDHLSVTRAQIDAAIEDFSEALARNGGGGARAIAKLRLTTSLAMGDVEAAERHFTAWMDAPRDDRSDCPACDVNTEARMMAQWGRHADSLDRAAPLLTGRLRCGEVPQFTYPRATMAYFHLGRLEEARDTFVTGYRQIRGSRRYLATVWHFLAFLGLTANHGPALTLLERHLAWALDARTQLDPLSFYRAARFVLAQIAATGEKEIAVALPRQFPLFREEGLYDVAALHAWFDEQATSLSARFDARNGNSYYTDELERSRRWTEEVRPFPVTTGLG